MQIEVRHLTKRFGRLRALDDLSLGIGAGERVALIGPNGSGKSTLNRVLMGLLHYEGDVRVGGASPREERVEIARRIAYVPQVAPQLSVPVRELVAALAPLRDMRRADLEKLAARLELDLDDVGARPFRGLSGGTRQKLLLVLAWAARPSLLILDEPTGSLDPRARERFLGLFAELPPETTVLLCSHRLEEIRQLVDRVTVLHEGRLAWDGPAARFLETSTTAVLEVNAVGEAAERWLDQHGFRRGTGSWWLRSVRAGEKLALLRELGPALGDGLRDADVRNLESLSLTADAAHAQPGDDDDR